MSERFESELARPSSPTLERRREQRFVIHGVSWKDYVVLREALDIPGLRMTYCKGMLELMSPSPEHEDDKKTIARLVEIHALERGVALYGYGNATFRKQAKDRGAEPDECWTVGRKLQDFPDIALEVVHTSGGIDKLLVYEGLGVREVWLYEDRAFHLHELARDGYHPIETSRLVPDLDFAVLTRFVHMNDQHEAVKGYRDWLRARNDG
jgi:Uma2 family endonuclease